jgi:hypothetical protein
VQTGLLVLRVFVKGEHCEALHYLQGGLDVAQDRLEVELR